MEINGSSQNCNVNSRTHQEQEVVFITPELSRKLTQSGTRQRKYIAPFYWDVKRDVERQFFSSSLADSSDWEFKDPSSYVKLPFDKFKFRTDSQQEASSKNNRWNQITSALNVLKAMVIYWRDVDECGMDREQILLEFRRAICSYCNKNTVWWMRWFWWDVDAISQDDELLDRFIRALPGIIDHAIKLPTRLEQPIPVLKSTQNHTLCLTRNLVCSLLANAFLCTFPNQEDDDKKMASFNFCWLFSSSWIPCGTKIKGEKIKCFLEYFEQMEMEESWRPDQYPNIFNSVITFERRCYKGWFDWEEPTKEHQLCEMEITGKRNAEAVEDIIQVEFASNMAGGGVLGHDAGKAEVRFFICPELMVALLFTEKLAHDEALVITGARQFSAHSGYQETFIWRELTGKYATIMRLDSLGRELSQVVLTELQTIFPLVKLFEINQQRIQRELRQCYVTFAQDQDQVTTPVATGSWRCGLIGGDPQLSFLAQWMAASVQQRKVLYHARDKEEQQKFENMAAFLRRKHVSVSRLYSILIRYGLSVWLDLPFKKSLFAFLIECLSK